MKTRTQLRMAAITLCLLLLISGQTQAEVPGMLNYQGRVIENDTLVSSNGMAVTLTLYDASSGGTAVYQEDDTVNVVDGLFATHFGDNPETVGVTHTNLADALAAVGANGWLGVALGGGTELTPRERLLAAPFALRSAQVEQEMDPLYSSSVAASITASDTSQWHMAYGWGDHAGVGYLTGYTETDPIWSAVSNAISVQAGHGETAYGWGDHGVPGYLTSESDPVFGGSAASGIGGGDIANWDTAYGWGDHAGVGYLTGYTETDPIWSAVSNAISVQAGHGETAYGWGDHSAPGYLTSESDPVFGSSAASGIGGGDIANWDTAYGWGDHAGVGYLTGYTETDPIWTAVSNTISVQAGHGETAYGWGDHDAAGYASAADLTTASNSLQSQAADNYSLITNRVAKTGDTMTGALTVNNNVIIASNLSVAGYVTNATYYGDGVGLTNITAESFAETDPVYGAAPAAGITTADTQNWTTAYSWGDHSVPGYLTSESDPIFGGSAASGIGGGDIANWDTAYGWGDHAAVGYLTGYTETDPIWSAVSNAISIQAGHGETAYGWGDHDAAGYASAADLTTASNSLQSQAADNYSLITNRVAKTGDAMTGALSLPGGGLSVGTTQLVLLSNGNVGIGTTNPLSKLEVRGQIRCFAPTNFTHPFMARNSFGGRLGAFYQQAAGSSNYGHYFMLYGEDEIPDVAFRAQKTYYFLGGNLGIGTTSPTEKFHLESDTNGLVTAKVYNPNAGGSAIARFGAHNGGGWISMEHMGLAHTGTGARSVNRGLLVDSSLGLGLAAADPCGDIRLYTAGLTENNERIRITHTGNVGIGTTNPTEQLSVAGVIESTSGGFKFPDGSTQTVAVTDCATGTPVYVETDPVYGNSTAANITANDTNEWHTAYGWGDHGTAGYASGADLITASNSLQCQVADNYILITNRVAKTGDTMTGALSLPSGGLSVGTTQLVVLGDGRVGIGTASLTPLTQLDVCGDNIDGVLITLQNANVSGSLQNLTLGVGGSIAWSVTDWANAGIIEGPTDGGLVLSGYGAGGLKFQSGSGRITRMVVNTAGNVGIGVTSPVSPLSFDYTALDFNGTPNKITLWGEAGDPKYGLGISPSDLDYFSASNHRFHIVNSNAFVREDAMVVLGNGNVGIGTSNPTQLLTVAGVIESTSGGFKFPDGSTQIVAVTDYATGTPVYVEADPIYGNSTAANITANDTNEWHTAYGWGDHAAAGYASAADLTTASNSLQGQVADNYALITNRVAKTGDTMTGALTVNNNVIIASNLSVAGYVTNATYYGDGVGLTNVTAESFAETDPVYGAAPAAGITTADTQNWTTAYSWGDHSVPGYLTSESDPIFGGSAASGIGGGDIANWDTAYGWGDHAGVGYLTGYAETDPIWTNALATGFTAGGQVVLPAGGLTVGATQLVVLANGNVGIGTSSPTNELAVNGTIKCKEVIVTLADWSDFVFEEGYNLMPLEDVEQFIADNGHLPDIPSAEEVVASGVKMGEMQAKLLRKIEEITIHMIRIERENAMLRERLQKLETPAGKHTYF